MRSRLLSLALLAVLPAAAQEATATVRVDYLAVTSRGSSNWTVRGRLFGDGKIEEALDGTAGRERMAFKSNQRLGARWKVVAQNKLQRLYEYPNHFQFIDVEVDGKNCTAKMSTELKPGKTEYLVLGVNTSLVNVSKSGVPGRPLRDRVSARAQAAALSSTRPTQSRSATAAPSYDRIP